MTARSIETILTRSKTVALVGASDNPARDSHEVMAFLLAKGFDVTPVNPLLAGKTIHGRKVVASLMDIAGSIDIVDVFRASEHVPAIVDEAIAVGAKVIWMQLGVVHEGAAQKARGAGLTVIMDRCPKIEWARLGFE